MSGLRRTLFATLMTLVTIAAIIATFAAQQFLVRPTVTIALCWSSVVDTNAVAIGVVLAVAACGVLAVTAAISRAAAPWNVRAAGVCVLVFSVFDLAASLLWSYLNATYHRDPYIAGGPPCEYSEPQAFFITLIAFAPGLLLAIVAVALVRRRRDRSPLEPTSATPDDR
jgi:hypothetical protein